MIFQEITEFCRPGVLTGRILQQASNPSPLYEPGNIRHPTSNIRHPINSRDGMKEARPHHEPKRNVRVKKPALTMNPKEECQG
jgi:hypothetical protein